MNNAGLQTSFPTNTAKRISLSKTKAHAVGGNSMSTSMNCLRAIQLSTPRSQPRTLPTLSHLFCQSEDDVRVRHHVRVEGGLEIGVLLECAADVRVAILCEREHALRDDGIKLRVRPIVRLAESRDAAEEPEQCCAATCTGRRAACFSRMRKRAAGHRGRASACTWGWVIVDTPPRCRDREVKVRGSEEGWLPETVQPRARIGSDAPIWTMPK